MDFVFELKARMRTAVWPAVAICVLGYLVYHIIHGDRGLLAWQTVQTDISDVRRDLTQIQAERATLDRNVRLLHPDSLDADMLDEWARRHLNYGQPEDIVIFTDASGLNRVRTSE